MTVVLQAFPDFMPPRFKTDQGSVVSTAAGRRTIQLPIDTGVLCLRGLSPERHRFELEYALERGSTANSVLFEAVRSRRWSRCRARPSARGGL